METEGLSKKRVCLYIEQNLWREFKKICSREGVKMSPKIEGFVAREVAVHMKGNPQLRLEPFIGESKAKCFKCRGLFPDLIRVEFISGLRAGVCSTDFKDYKKRGLIKRVLS